MSKRILCVVDKYFPNESANTICAEKIMNIFKQKGYLVDYYVIKNDRKEKKYFKEDGSCVFYAKNFFVNLSLIAKRKLKVRTYSDAPKKLKGKLDAIGKIFTLGKVKTSNWIVDTLNHRSACRFFKKIHKRTPYEYILSFSAPFAMTIGANKINKTLKTAKWFAFFLDPFVYNCSLPDDIKTIAKRKNLANKILKNTKTVFCAKGILEENERNNFRLNSSIKIKEFHLPNLEVRKNIVNNANLNKETISCVFAGKFYEDIRNPKKMFEFFEKTDSEINLTTIGDGCSEIVSQFQDLLGKRYNKISRVPYSQCQELLNNSDILINLGNTVTNQVPSKVFEYIASGKPIVNFYFNDNDSSLFYLKKYSLCLNINVNHYNQNEINLFNEFCKKNAGKVISFEEATKDLKDCISNNVIEDIFDKITSNN